MKVGELLNLCEVPYNVVIFVEQDVWDNILSKDIYFVTNYPDEYRDREIAHWRMEKDKMIIVLL